MKDYPQLWCVVPAAGIGARMGAEVPKQYIPINGLSILERTLSVLLNTNLFERIVVAISSQDEWFAQLPISQHEKIVAVIGGEHRSDSVMAGLDYLSNYSKASDWVMVHDAARPFVKKESIAHLFECVREKNTGGILAVPVTDTLKRSSLNQYIQKTVSRENMWQAQTPQCFSFEILRNALTHCNTQNLPITDEASAIEAVGLDCLLVLGRVDNIKITHPEDLLFAEFIAEQQK